MADAASIAKMKALAQYFRDGGANPNLMPSTSPTLPDLSGRLSDAGLAGLPPAQNVAPGMNSDVSAPEGHAGAGTIDQMNAIRAMQLQQNNLHNQIPQESDLSGYAAYPGPLPQKAVEQKLRHQANQDDAESAAPRFSNLGYKLSGGSGPQEVTDDEDEDKNTRGSTKDTGTLGGI